PSSSCASRHAKISSKFQSSVSQDSLPPGSLPALRSPKSTNLRKCTRPRPSQNAPWIKWSCAMVELSPDSPATIGGEGCKTLAYQPAQMRVRGIAEKHLLSRKYS